MNHQKMTIEEAVKYILTEDTNDDFSFRGDDFTPDSTFNNSWYHGDEEDEFELDGVSAIKIVAFSEEYIRKAAGVAQKYGKKLFLLQGRSINAHEWANDPGECLMETHKIVAVIG